MTNFVRWLLAFLAVALIGVAVYLSLTHEKLDIIPKYITETDSYGQSHKRTILQYSDEYKICKITSELLTTIGIALLVYVFIERSLADRENLHRQLIENDKRTEADARSNFEKQESIKREDQFKRELQQLNHEITINVFNGVLKTVIPAEVFDILNADILNKKVIRKNVEWDYEIEDMAEGYHLTQKIAYDCVNISQSEQTYPLQVKVDNNSNQACNIDENFEFEKYDGTPIINLEPLIKKSNHWLYQIILQPMQTIRVKYRIYYQYNNHHIIDAHYTNTAILYLNFTIRKPEDCQFRAFGTFSSKLELADQDSKTLKYKPVKGLLTGQTLIYMIDKQYPETQQPTLNIPPA